MGEQQKSNWWGRNWKWFVPVGCLGSLILFAGFIILILGLVFGVMKSSEAYQSALAETKAHPMVQQALGTPIEAGLFMAGNINISGSSGHADLAIPVSGPNGEGIIYAVAVKSAGKWTFSTLVVELKKTKQRIDLLE